MTASASKSLVLALLAGVALAALPAYAGKTDMQTLNVAGPGKKDAGIVKADYKRLESAGLYRSATEGGLGRDLWKDTPRSALVALLEDLPVASQEPTVQKLIFGALLSATDASLINNDIPPEPGRDILTLRLEKLIQAGAYKQAQDLYSSFDEIEPYHERLARAGILAMMLNGEKSLACVEANTAKDNLPESQFLSQILAFCDVTISDAPSPESREILAGLNLRNLDLLGKKNAAIAYNTENFENLSLIEKAFLISDAKINFEKSNDADFQKIPPAHLRALLALDNLSAKSRFLLLAAAESWGLTMPGEMEDMYKAVVPPASGVDLGSLQVPVQAEDWEKIAYFYTIATHTEDKKAVWPALRNGMAVGNHYGIASLAPYAGQLLEIQPVDATDKEIETAAKLINSLGKPLPSQWAELVKARQITDAQTIDNKRIYAIKLAQKIEDEKPKSELMSTPSPYPAGSTVGYFLNKIIENVDKAAGNSDNADRIYEKEYGLTFKHDYVMPSVSVWNRLKAGQSNTGETVLLTASVLQTAPLGEIYPGVLTDALTGLNNVGLTDLSTNIATAAILGTIQQN